MRKCAIEAVGRVLVLEYAGHQATKDPVCEVLHKVHTVLPCLDSLWMLSFVYFT